MDSRLPETSREKLEAWLRYYDDLGLGEFFTGRRAMGKRSVKTPAVPLQTAATATPTATSAATAAASSSTIQGAPARILPVVPATSLFEAIDRVEGDTLELVRENLGECTRCRLHKQRNKIVFGA